MIITTDPTALYAYNTETKEHAFIGGFDAKPVNNPTGCNVKWWNGIQLRMSTEYPHMHFSVYVLGITKRKLLQLPRKYIGLQQC